MSRHPVTPADESDLSRHLARQTAKRIDLFDILKVALPEAASRAALDALIAKGAEIVLFDVLYADQLARIGNLIDAHANRERPLFSAGSSGIEMALGAHWAAHGRLRENVHWPAPGPANPLLVVSGSCSPVTGGQIAWALANGFTGVMLEPGADSGPAASTALAALAAGRNVVVYTSRGEIGGAPFSASELGGSLGRLAREAVVRSGVKRLVIAGGDTSSYAARALGIEAVEMIAPLAPGAPLCRARAPGSSVDGIEINFKGGQVGAEDYFGAVAAGSL